MPGTRGRRERGGAHSRRRVTLAEVAKAAGVSRTTASYIASGRDEQMRIAPDTARRVTETMQQLGYRPNRAAQSLRTASTATIGVITDFAASGEFSAKLLLGAGAEARRRDHVLMISETGGDPEVEARALGELVARGVDGVIYSTRTDSLIAIPEGLRNVPTVLLNCLDTAGTLPAVVPDEEGGGWAAAGVLVDARVGAAVYLVGENPSPEARAGVLRRAGIDQRLAAAGFTLRGQIDCPWDVGSAYWALSARLAEGERFEALICYNDRIAMGVCQALAEHGLRVGQEVSVVSFDGSDLASWLRPRVTSVELPFVRMGELAVSRLIETAQPGAAVSPRVDVVAMTVQHGESVRCHERGPLSKS